jgi:hypothetical protein
MINATRTTAQYGTTSASYGLVKIHGSSAFLTGTGAADTELAAIGFPLRIRGATPAAAADDDTRAKPTCCQTRPWPR